MVIAFWGVRSAAAQLALPSIAVTSTEARTLTPAEADWYIEFEELRLDTAFSFRAVHYPKDSILARVSSEATRWLTKLQNRPIKGLQLDPAGTISVAAHQEATARAQIAERLATPGLPLADRAYTYLTAVNAFASWHFPERLPVAEEYLKRLDALGPAAGQWRFAARSRLVSTYFLLGKTGEMVKHGVAAIHLLSSMPFADQRPEGLRVLYVNTMQGLTALPNAQVRIDSLHEILRKTVEAPPGLLALDPQGVQWESRNREYFVRQMVTTNQMLGKIGKPFVANYWVNRATHDSASIQLDDGKIHLVETFPYTCAGCVAMLHGLQRIKNQRPDIDIFGVTFTNGAWGNRLVEPREEAQHIESYVINKMKLSLPIGIWMAPKIASEDGGSSPGSWNGPNNQNYPVLAKSVIWVFDGQGRLRRIFLTGGNGEREMEHEIIRTVEFLERETEGILFRKVASLASTAP